MAHCPGGARHDGGEGAEVHVREGDGEPRAGHSFGTWANTRQNRGERARPDLAAGAAQVSDDCCLRRRYCARRAWPQDPARHFPELRDQRFICWAGL